MERNLVISGKCHEYIHELRIDLLQTFVGFSLAAVPSRSLHASRARTSL